MVPTKERIITGKNIFTIIMCVITFIIVISTFVGIFSGRNIPSGNILASSILCMGLPFLIIANILLIIFWGIYRKLIIIVPIITLLFCIDFIGTIYQFGTNNNEVKPNITIASYNVGRFLNENDMIKAQAIFNGLKAEDADIICLQEYREEQDNAIEKYTSNDYPYIAIGKNDMIIFSKFPIKAFDLIDFGETNNSALWADIEVEKGKIIKVYNTHMQTTGINSVLHEISRGRINSNDKESALAGSFESGIQIRASQAIKIANHMANCNIPKILCGDFNDTPYSFTYRTLLADMEDGFRTSGKGFMHTYRGMKSLFRIDYIFHSKELKGVQYYTKEWEYSDHNPVIMKLAIGSSH